MGFVAVYLCIFMHSAHTSGSEEDGTHPCDQSHLCKSKSGGFLCSHTSSDDYSVILTAAPNHATTVLTEGNYCSLVARKDREREGERLIRKEGDIEARSRQRKGSKREQKSKTRPGRQSRAANLRGIILCLQREWKKR